MSASSAGLWIVADEIYSKLIYDGRRFVSIAQLGSDVRGPHGPDRRREQGLRDDRLAYRLRRRARRV